MRLGDFIETCLEPILAEWEVFARGITAGAKMDALALRDHAAEILIAVKRDMDTAQSNSERAEKSKGYRPEARGGRALDVASEAHAIERLGSGFDLVEVVSEYRALRASVLKLWRESGPDAGERDVDDITRFNETLDQLMTMAVRSYTKRVDQARDMFLAILGHDLRNPLNSIAMSAEVLPHLGDDPAEARVCTAQINTNVSVMARMINDLLDYTRTRLGTGMPVDIKPMDLGRLGREVFDEFRSAHRDRDIRYQADGGLLGEWDADRIRQAVSNLMGNAVQHGATDAPVELKIRGEGTDVLIEVHNGGPPISAGELSKIFDPLIRGSSADRPQSNRPGSIGLGLYIAREVAKSHGGQVDVTSTTTEGTTFTIRLPRHAVNTTERPVMDEEQIRNM